MKLHFLRATLPAMLAGALALAPALAYADTDAEVQAHEAVLDLAGAFTNDGFKLRDGTYCGELKKGEAVLVQVNLYAGNQYWFSVATADPKTDVTINLYDEAGKLVTTEPYSDAPRAAAGYAPDASGPYFVRIANPGAPAVYSLIYSYK
jgi:hypothetical protein